MGLRHVDQAGFMCARYGSLLLLSSLAGDVLRVASFLSMYVCLYGHGRERNAVQAE